MYRFIYTQCSAQVCFIYVRKQTTQKLIMGLIHALLPGQKNKAVLKIDTNCFHILVDVASLFQSFSCCSSFCRSLAPSQVYQTQPAHLLPTRLQKKEGRTEPG